MNWDAVAVAVALLIGALTLYFSARQITKQLKVMTFLEFTRRYSEIIDRLPHVVRIDPDRADLEKLADSDRASTELAIRSYFNLCSEEHFLYGERLVTKRVWVLWRRGLLQALRTPAVRQVWQQARSNYHDEFRAEIDRYIAAAARQ